MKYDLIIVARSTTDRLKQVTQNCINSAIAEGEVNVIVVETSGARHEYTGADDIIMFNEPFRYNAALNIGLMYAKSDVHILANNDLVFFKGWSRIGEDMINNNFDSASAWFQGCPLSKGECVYEGYDIAVQLTGWCLFITSHAMRRIVKLREEMEFWYSDNLYAMQLREAGLRHGLFGNVRVDHLSSETLSTMPVNIRRKYSIGQLAKFNQLCVRKK